MLMNTRRPQSYLYNTHLYLPLMYLLRWRFGSRTAGWNGGTQRSESSSQVEEPVRPLSPVRTTPTLTSVTSARTLTPQHHPSDLTWRKTLIWCQSLLIWGTLLGRTSHILKRYLCSLFCIEARFSRHLYHPHLLVSWTNLTWILPFIILWPQMTRMRMKMTWTQMRRVKSMCHDCECVCLSYTERLFHWAFYPVCHTDDASHYSIVIMITMAIYYSRFFCIYSCINSCIHCPFGSAMPFNACINTLMRCWKLKCDLYGTERTVDSWLKIC